MKALLFVTGRGVGGDAVIALNTALALSKDDIECEFVLDHEASGYLFKKKGLNWYKTRIPQAGGHAASKMTILKAGVKTLKASREAAKLCRKVSPDVVVGVIGGGAIIGCTAAKMARIPSVGMVATPTDSKIISSMTTTLALPESPLFNSNKKNILSSYLPINPEITIGDKKNALESLPDSFDEDLPTILFSSGSSLFEKMAKAPQKVKDKLNANMVVVGDPLKESFNEYLEDIIHLGYVNNLPDLYDLADLAVLSDDGLMIHEALACEVPIIALTRVKYGRYHNMANIFPGAVIESELDDLYSNIELALEQKSQLNKKTKEYATKILEAPYKISKIVSKQI